MMIIAGKIAYYACYVCIEDCLNFVEFEYMESREKNLKFGRCIFLYSMR